MLLSSMWGWPCQSVMIVTGVLVDSNMEKRYFRLDNYTCSIIIIVLASINSHSADDVDFVTLT